MSRRLHFKRIDSSGTFRSGDIRLDVKFHDEEGNEYVWFPRWEDLRNLYAEAERVENLNPTGDKDLSRLKSLKQLDDTVINEIAEIIADTWTGDSLGKFFRQLGHDVDYGYQIEENARTFPAETGGPDRVRKQFVLGKLRELNEEDYELVVKVVEKMASRKEHINDEERRKTVLYRLNKALEHEGWEVTRDGNVQPIQHDEDEQ
jgi:hypothetical protein